MKPFKLQLNLGALNSTCSSALPVQRSNMPKFEQVSKVQTLAFKCLQPEFECQGLNQSIQIDKYEIAECCLVTEGCQRIGTIIWSPCKRTYSSAILVRTYSNFGVFKHWIGAIAPSSDVWTLIVAEVGVFRLPRCQQIGMIIRSLKIWPLPIGDMWNTCFANIQTIRDFYIFTCTQGPPGSLVTQLVLLYLCLLKKKGHILFLPLSSKCCLCRNDLLNKKVTWLFFIK